MINACLHHAVTTKLRKIIVLILKKKKKKEIRYVCVVKGVILVLKHDTELYIIFTNFADAFVTF